MTEEQKQALIADMQSEKLVLEKWRDDWNARDKVNYQAIDIALSALTQTASPALKLPDEVTPKKASRSYGGQVVGYLDGWNACLAEVKRLNAPHTAPIEPICATGGAEWVRVSDEMPNPLSSKRVCVYTPSEHDDFRFRFVPANLFRTVCSDATHWHYMEVPND